MFGREGEKRYFITHTATLATCDNNRRSVAIIEYNTTCTRETTPKTRSTQAWSLMIVLPCQHDLSVVETVNNIRVGSDIYKSGQGTLMGSGIAQVIAQNGCRVLVVDNDEYTQQLFIFSSFMFRC